LPNSNPSKTVEVVWEFAIDLSLSLAVADGDIREI